MLKLAYLFLDDRLSTSLITRWCAEEDYIYAKKFKRERRQKQSLAGRCLLRMLWALDYLTGPTLTILSGEQGEPILQSSPSLKVWGAITHSQNLVCVALSFEGPIGIDVEKLDMNRDVDQLLSYWNIDKNDNNFDAYKQWTKLEAFAKAQGKGLSTSLVSEFLQHNHDELFRHIHICDYILTVIPSSYGAWTRPLKLEYP